MEHVSTDKDRMFNSYLICKHSLGYIVLITARGNGVFPAPFSNGKNQLFIIPQQISCWMNTATQATIMCV